MELRFCCICCEDKSKDCFYFAANTDGLSYQCKECLKEYRRHMNIDREYYKRYYYRKKGLYYVPSQKVPTPSKKKSGKVGDGVAQKPEVSFSVGFD